MNEVTLPPSPNWYLSNILACANDGTIAWGARNAIVIAKTKESSKILDYSIIDRTHNDRVTSIAFSPKSEEDGSYRLVSGGDDTQVKIWNLKSLSMEIKNSKLDGNHKIVGVDWSKYNPNLVCFVSENGFLVTWYINYDTSQIITLGKITATCLVCCPHDNNIVSIGSKSGLVYIVDIRGSGSITYKLRGHDVDIVSLSWCPVPGNIFENKNTKELLLASGAKDRSIFLWKAGTDGRYQVQLICPVTPSDSNTHKTKVSSSAGNYTAVCWLEPTKLLSSSSWGELLLWDLTGEAKKKFTPKLIHAKHGKGLFSIAGLIDKSDLVDQVSVEQTETANNETENWRTKTNIKAIWTLGQDRQIICCSIVDNEPLMDYIIPTQGGFVYCMSACPVDTSQIAFGVGDAMIRLWNLSESHENVVEIQVLWEKIKGKVRALSWHPEKENLLAFATNEGRVGIFDTNNKKAPTICRQYHRHIIYSIGWGPAPNIKGYALFTCGDGELVYYNPEKWNENPIPVTKKKDCTEFCWKSDYSILALGFGDGSIHFLNSDLSDYGHTIYALNKAIQYLAWHPESTTSDLNISAMKNYLAVAINDPVITVFDIPSKSNSDEKVPDESFFKTVAVLNAHREKVVCLAWSPHISGYLVSGSYDHVAQVWKVETQEVIATFTSHLGPIQCCMWSPLSQDLIITGSSDFSLRIWNISNQKILTSPSSTRVSTKGKRTKKKKVKETINGSQICVERNTAPVIKENEISNIIEYPKESINQELSEEHDSKKNDKLGKKKKQKKPNYFPNHSEITNNNKLWCSTIKHTLDSIKADTQNSESGEFACNGADSPSEKKKNGILPAFLGNVKDFENSLNYEKKLLDSTGYYNYTTEIDLWSGNLKENLQKAMKEKRLNDSLMLLAPSISKEFWEEMCAAYANQLVLDENPHKAAACLLCINKTEEAIDVFMNAKLYKEAYALASLRFGPKSPIVENILKKWADVAQKYGNYQHAVECCIKLGEFVKAAKLLERRKDLDSLILAINVAKVANDSDLSMSLADKAILEALLKSNVKVAKSIIEEYPPLQCRQIQAEIFDEISKVVEDFTDEKILLWLQGSPGKGLLDCIKERFSKCEKSYSSLLQKDCFPLPSDQKMVQVNVSQQLALSVLASEKKLQFQHIVKALDVIAQYEKSKSPSVQQKCSLLMKYICALDNKNLSDPNSIFKNDDNSIAESLRAYLCYGTINWFHDNNLNETQVSESTNLIMDILEKCVEDLLNKESIKFWTAENEINKLENELSSIIGKVQKPEEDDTEEKQNIVERLDSLKSNRKKFIDNRVASPNPLFSYGAIMEFTSKITNEEVQQRITELVMNTWKKAIS